MRPTIFAKASGAGRAGVAVYRISGPEAGRILTALTGKPGKPRMTRRVAVRRSDGSLIDDGLALWFPGPHSFTGEDVAELQLHGSLAVEEQLSSAIAELGGVPAQPGAFTWRAFEHGKLDLTQVEGLADLLEADTALQHQQAMAGYRGALREKAEEWRGQLIAAMAQLDAAVDFPDEEDVPELIEQRALPIVRELTSSIAQVVEASRAAEKVAEGLSVAILGPPNAGKSSLFNALIRDERSIVSPIPGTTRDVVSATVELGGLRVTFHDLAGIREETEDMIEAEGISRAKKLADQADLRILCTPLGGSKAAWFDHYEQPGDLSVITKDDQLDAGGVTIQAEESIARLRDRTEQILLSKASPGLAPTQRQRSLLLAALNQLESFEAASLAAPELGSEVLREATAQLEYLLGRVAPDEVLDDIFSSFCIGK
ncbi:tRNA uridine-5-carboxymethylaminomethyl(34) synthesis GTPase MnmE [Parvularcula maris]|uniref:tRNA modification GTPase MnmE n=1 Tax=Parvularcula maris TaxID=2965077 RepID=A0A9X2L696_9PROT|nr:tRNA uridine-5-carboxymethylaminomethyl(34) synthesis GTPase MnmE [Parvularcula maris]MCQ8183815.1 tRNA uridine-5-carboxymethylaminomethyl(34) synthesis GTPase MnmE [Parvularcula maris]